MSGPPTILIWGTCDFGKPRMRILRAALAEVGLRVEMQHVPVWEGVEDKSGLRSPVILLRYGLRYLWALLRLWLMYFRAPPHDVVLIGYMGQFDVLAFRPLALLFRRPVIWDAFLSLYESVVIDRKLVSRKHPVALLLRGAEWLACRAVSRVVLDTEAHAQLFRQLYGLGADRTAAVFVGAETGVFCAAPALPIEPEDGPPAGADETMILFYGQFIPLHGIETIVKAAILTRDRPYRWMLIGQGQEEARIRALIDGSPPLRLTWIPWVPYEDLIVWLRRADVCLGIFGDTGKASRVIPNKVFQILSAGRPLITRDSPAIRELLPPSPLGVYLVRPADPEALVVALERFRADRPAILAIGERLHTAAREQFSLPALGAAWSSIIHEASGMPPPARAATR